MNKVKKSNKGSKWANGAAGFPNQKGRDAPGKPNATLPVMDGGKKITK